MSKLTLLLIFITFISGFTVGVYTTKASSDSNNSELIKEMENDINILERQVRQREAEISYWGQKLEQCQSLQKQ